MRPTTGSLSFATGTPGKTRVRCVHINNDAFAKFWERYAKLSVPALPTLGVTYLLRANVGGHPEFIGEYRTGVLLSFLDKKPFSNIRVVFGNGYGGEVYFPFNWFIPLTTA